MAPQGDALQAYGIRPLGHELQAASSNASTTSFDSVALKSINLRDLGSVTPVVSKGLVFRSSQVVSPTDLKKLGIRAVLDLRKADVSCQVHTHNMGQKISRAVSSLASWFWHGVLRQRGKIDRKSKILVPEDILDEAAPCWRCSRTCAARYGTHAKVYHVDLLPGMATLMIFVALPFWLQAKTLYMKVRREHPEPLVAAAVADNRIFGYLKLYKIILNRSRSQLISALRLLLHVNNFPILVHCQHGKDRTGLVVMLMYLLCGVPRDVIISDYALSESLLREGRENRELLGLPEDFTTDQIMSSTADVMSKTLDFLETKHGGVEHYLRSGGMHDDEIARIRGAIMVPSGADSDGGASTGAEEASLSSGEGALANGNALHVIEEEGEAE